MVKLRVSVEVKRDAYGAAVIAALARAIKQTFEVSADMVLRELGTLARQFETSVKAPRFADWR